MKISEQDGKNATGKVAQAGIQLEAMARSLGDHARLPGVRVLREKLNVSWTTLQDVLNELEARQVIYKRQGSGIYVSPKRDQRNILLLCDYSQIRTASHSPFWDIVADSARARAASHKETVRLHFTSILDSPEEPLPLPLLQEVQSGRIHGILGAIVHEKTARQLCDLHVPFVSLGSPGQGTVSLDFSAMVRCSVRALVEHGCQRIGFLQSVAPYFPTPVRPSLDDYEGFSAYKLEMASQGMEFNPRWVEMGLELLDNDENVTRQSHQEQGYYAIQRIFTERSHDCIPDGLVITDDLMTHGALTALHNLGMQVGRDIHIASHANKGSMVLLGHTEKLFLLEFEPAEVVNTMFQMLETLMDGEALTQSEILITPKLSQPTHFDGTKIQMNGQITFTETSHATLTS